MTFKSKFESGGDNFIAWFDTPFSSEIVEEVYEEVNTVKLDTEEDSITDLFWGSSWEKF